MTFQTAPMRPPPRVRKDERLDMRVSSDEKALFEQAAHLTGRTLTDFLRESAATTARMLLADRMQFVLPPDRWAAFAAAIDREPTDRPRLAAFLAEPSVLDRDR